MVREPVMSSALNTEFEMEPYQVGDKDQRSWGWYEVTGLGYEGTQEFCEKKIGMKPKQATSLQRHQGRAELWTVLSGEMTVIVNAVVHHLKAGDSIEIPLMAPHCTINASGEEVVFFEKQTGICREADNERIADIAGRPVIAADPSDAIIQESIRLYQELTGNL